MLTRGEKREVKTLVEQFEHETSRFIEADANGAPTSPDDSFMVLSGTSCVMVSAPHSVSQWRNEHLKSAEHSTGALALLAHEHLGCPIIFKTANAHDDANFDDESPYRDALAAYIANHDVQLLLDLHQLSCERPMEICVGTGRMNNVAGHPELVDRVVEVFGDHVTGEITIDDPFAASGANTIACSISERCGIPCFQIEINSRLLMDTHADYDPEGVFAAIARIVSDIEERVKDGRLARR